jgi:hypothetical protein
MCYGITWKGARVCHSNRALDMQVCEAAISCRVLIWLQRLAKHENVMRLVRAQDASLSLSPFCKRARIEGEMDLQLLAQTAHAMEGVATAATSAKGPFAGRQQPALSGGASHGPGVTSDLAGLSGCNTGDVEFRLPTTTRSTDFGPNKQHKHRAAEQRRRERINEK